MTVVIDAGVALAALLNDDEHTAWARAIMAGEISQGLSY